jgi:hypothetical protein
VWAPEDRVSGVQEQARIPGKSISRFRLTRLGRTRSASDTLARIEAKTRRVAEEVAAWHELAVSTDGAAATA